jgi:hypothetical protein
VPGLLDLRIQNVTAKKDQPGLAATAAAYSVPAAKDAGQSYNAACLELVVRSGQFAWRRPEQARRGERRESPGPSKTRTMATSKRSRQRGYDWPSSPGPSFHVHL